MGRGFVPWPLRSRRVESEPVGVVLFGLYSATYEMIRIGNTHMSYRGGRSPWSQHQSELLVGGIILFALVAAYRHVRDRAESRESQAIEHAV